MFFIKVKIKGYLENITENTKENIDTLGIKNKNNISYINNNTMYKINCHEDKIIFTRDNKEFIHNFIFKINTKSKSNYYIKEYNTNIDVEILTTKILNTENKIEIYYKIIDSNNEYKYMIEMR